jgi:glyoxalase-like protein
MSIRLRQICLVAAKLAPVVDDLKAVLGLEVCFKDKGVEVFGLENSLFPVGSNFIEVVAPIKENTAAGRYLKRRNGDGGYMVICQCDSEATQAARKARAASLNVRVAWEHDSKGFHGMQLHPADTGGAFFELDWDKKGEPEGHWEPAGGSNWASARRTDVVTSFSAVELQSADPRGLAERWSSIAELPLRNDSRGRIEMPLDNASVRFVEATDGRGEGLGGIDIVVADRKRLLEAAESRGCRAGDEQVVICGTRFYLS